MDSDGFVILPVRVTAKEVRLHTLIAGTLSADKEVVNFAQMDWGTGNRYGYLATSLPSRYRLLWSATSALVVAAFTAWLVGWVPAVVTFGIGTATFFLMAWVTDLAAWRPVAGVCIAALCGTGSGALWWALTRGTATIWMPMLSGVGFCLIAVMSFADILRRLGPPQE